MARVAVLLRALEHGLSSLSTLGRKRRFVACAGSPSKRRAYRRRFSILALDSTFVKASPCAAGALKKRTAGDRSDKGWSHDQDSRDPRRSDDAGRPKTLAWERQRRARRARNPRSLNVKRLKSKFVLMNRAYEGDETRQTARDVGLKPVVPPKRNRRKLWRYNKNFTNAATKPNVSFDVFGGLPSNCDALR